MDAPPAAGLSVSGGVYNRTMAAGPSQSDQLIDYHRATAVCQRISHWCLKRCLQWDAWELGSENIFFSHDFNKQQALIK